MTYRCDCEERGIGECTNYKLYQTWKFLGQKMTVDVKLVNNTKNTENLRAQIQFPQAALIAQNDFSISPGETKTITLTDTDFVVSRIMEGQYTMDLRIGRPDEVEGLIRLFYPNQCNPFILYPPKTYIQSIDMDIRHCEIGDNPKISVVVKNPMGIMYAQYKLLICFEKPGEDGCWYFMDGKEFDLGMNEEKTIEFQTSIDERYEAGDYNIYVRLLYLDDTPVEDYRVGPFWVIKREITPESAEIIKIGVNGN